MPKSPKDGKLIYHFTPLRNLENILKSGLKPRAVLQRESTDFTDVASQEMILDRHKLELEEYTPFHFFPNNPFDGRVRIDNGAIDYVYITVKRTVARAQGYKVIPRHPMNIHKHDETAQILYDFDEGMNVVEWDIMATRDYKDENTKHICMAECVKRGIVTPHEICNIFVENDNILKEVQELWKEIFGKNPSSFDVSLNPQIFPKKRQ